MIKAVIFDLDGTLVKSLEGLLYAFQEALKKNNLPVISREEFGKLYGQMDTEILRKFLNKPKVDKEIENVARLKRKLFVDEGVKYITAIPGALEFVDALFQRKIPMAIASSGRSSAIEITLKKFGMQDKIRIIVSADDITHSKPHPEIFLKAAEKLKIPPENCIVFEDSPHGILAAKAANMACAAVTTGTTSREELKKLRPTYIFDSLNEALPPKLDDILSK